MLDRTIHARVCCKGGDEIGNHREVFDSRAKISRMVLDLASAAAMHLAEQGRRVARGVIMETVLIRNAAAITNRTRAL